MTHADTPTDSVPTHQLAQPCAAAPATADCDHSLQLLSSVVVFSLIQQPGHFLLLLELQLKSVATALDTSVLALVLHASVF